MPARKKPLRVPQTCLIDVLDALASIGSTVSVTAYALGRHTDGAAASHAGEVLLEHVAEPLERQKEIIDAHVQVCPMLAPMHTEHLVKRKRRKKRAPNGSRKGKKRQRNRWKERQAALKPWER